jgi:fatty-acyl-CoA synthase
LTLALESWATGEPVPTVADLLRSNAASRVIRDKTLLRFEQHVWSYAEYYRESCRFGNLFSARLRAGRPRHVGIIAENTPDYLFAFSGAALSRATIVTLNLTQRDEHLLRDVRHTDVALLIVQEGLLPLVDELSSELDRAGVSVLVSRRFESGPASGPSSADFEDLDSALAGVSVDDPGGHPEADETLILTFTSGTSGAPKAVPWTHERIVGGSRNLAEIIGLRDTDVGYMAMPLFHANSIVCNWAPVMVTGASIAMVRRFSASRWLTDVRQFGATYANYVGKPITYILATPAQPDDGDNPLRMMFGNEGSSPRIAEFAKRFGVTMFETYGTSEGGISIRRDENTPAYALGPAPPGVRIVDDDGIDTPRARFSEHGQLLNPEECVGHLVQTKPVGAFSGYYKNEEATREYTRWGWLWTGDLAYIDDNGYVYFAGRGQDWIRVDGENFLGAPIEEIIARHPAVIMASVYGVPDPESGDQVMACVAVADPIQFDVVEFSTWLRSQQDLSPKWLPRFLRVSRDLPLNGSNKVLKRVLMRDKFRLDQVGDDVVYVWERKADYPVLFASGDEASLRQQFIATGRERFWDL